MGLLPSQQSGAFQVPLRGTKRKATVIEGGAAKAREIAISDCESDSASDEGDDDDICSSAPTPLTPGSSRASPQHPSDLHKTHHCPYEECAKSFNRPAKLAEHLRSHTNTRPFVCPHAPCTKDFLRESHLKHHVKSAHSDIRDYVCEWEGCGKSFITATRLRRHHAAHEGREKFRCTVLDCGQTFRKHTTLQKHVTTVHEGGYPFACELLNQDGTRCGTGFNSEGQMKSHAGRVHGINAFLCTICSSREGASDQSPNFGDRNTTFPTHAALQAHIQSDHPPTCAECGLRCTSKSALRNHVEIIHGSIDVNERKTHVCSEPECGRAFTKKGNLNAHIQISHAGKRFVCGTIDPKTLNNVEEWDGLNTCGEALTSKKNLERHIRAVHLGLGPFGKPKREKGEKSGKSAHAKQVSTLTRLTGSGYEAESGRDIACVIRGCKHRFLRAYDLEVHLQIRHGLAHPESQAILTERKSYIRPSLRGRPIFATREEIEAERAFSMESGRDITMGNTEESLEAGAIGNGKFWLGGEPTQMEHSSDEWLQDELDMKSLVNDDDDGKGIAGHAVKDVNMIDPSLR